MPGPLLPLALLPLNPPKTPDDVDIVSSVIWEAAGGRVLLGPADHRHRLVSEEIEDRHGKPIESGRSETDDANRPAHPSSGGAIPIGDHVPYRDSTVTSAACSWSLNHSAHTPLISWSLTKAAGSAR